MTTPAPRKTFGLKNAARPQAAPTKRAETRKGGGGLDIHPMVAAGGLAFVVAAAAVVMLGGQPPQHAGGPVIIEAPAARPQPAAAPAQPPKQGSGGKFGAATDAMSGIAR